FLAVKIFKSHHSGNFKKRRSKNLWKVFHLLNTCVHKILIAVFAVYFDSFSKINKMWRIVQPDFIASFMHYRGQHIARRTFPVGSANMDGFDFVLRISKKIAERSNILQSGFIGFLSVGLIIWSLSKEPFDSILILLLSHFAKVQKYFF